MLDTRRHLQLFFNSTFKLSQQFVFIAFISSFLIAFCIAFLPTYNLSDDAVMTLFILLFAAGLWISEAIPAFAVSLLIIALEIVFLGVQDFNFQDTHKDWKIYLAPWSSPLIFLFLADL